MTTLINASASSGLVQTADTSAILGLQTNGTTALTIDTSANVGIGTTTINNVVTTYRGAGVNNYIQFTNSTTGTASTDGCLIGVSADDTALRLRVLEAAPMIFTTSDTERMRIDSSGNLLVGKTATSVSEKVGISYTTDNPAMYITPTNASLSATIVYINTTRAASAGFDFFGGYANSTGQFRVTGAGLIYAQNTSIQSISDQRLKENIRDSSDGLSVISELRPVRYDWKEGYGNDQKNQLGFIAQEIETVFPEAVGEWQINKDDETTYKTVGPSALIPVLVKAIQELKAEVDELKAKVNA